MLLEHGVFKLKSPNCLHDVIRKAYDYKAAFVRKRKLWRCDDDILCGSIPLTSLCLRKASVRKGIL